MSDITIVHRPNSVRVVSWVDGFSWQCGECGWLGEGLASNVAAVQEAGHHWADKHPNLEAPRVRLLPFLATAPKVES